MKEINVKEVLRSKSPVLARWAPGFLINYLRRIVHEDEVNTFLHDFADCDSIGFVRAVLTRMNITYHAEGMEKLDPKGRYIFASNHPFGGLDGMVLADIVTNYFGDVRVIVNDLLMNITPLRGICVPINKHGRQNPEYVRMYNEAFASDIPMITFPAGLCSRRIRGVVADPPWKSNFVKRAIASRRDVVPVCFDGRLSNFFYRLSNIRKKLGVKANIEMLYLADEMLKQSDSHFTIRIGDPIPWQELKSGPAASEWAQKIRACSYGMMPPFARKQ